MPKFYLPGSYTSSMHSMRARTIAALLVAQGNPRFLTNGEMRRDVLTALMSKSAVNYWLNEKGWLEFVRQSGRVKFLRLTPDGIKVCGNSLAGGGEYPATQAEVDAIRRLMLEGGHGYTLKEFVDIKEEC